MASNFDVHDSQYGMACQIQIQNYKVDQLFAFEASIMNVYTWLHTQFHFKRIYGGCTCLELLIIH